MTTLFPAYMYLFIGFLSNMVTVYSVKKAQGFTVLLPTIAAMVTICIAQWMLSKSIEAGLDLGLAATLISVAVIGGAIVMGIVVFHEPMSTVKLAGLLVAVIGVTIASLAK